MTGNIRGGRGEVDGEDGEYVVKFKHVEFGHRDALVSVSASQSGRVAFVFQDIFIGAHEWLCPYRSQYPQAAAFTLATDW